jgi:hypothetical protein
VCGRRLRRQRGAAAVSLETMSVRSRIAIAFAILVVVAAACGSTSAPTSSPATSPSPGATVVPSSAPSASPAPATLLLKVTSEGGFINPAATLAALPTVAVYADGRIFVPGPVDSIAPAGLLAPLVVRDVGQAGAAAILAAIEQAGLDKPATGGPGIPGDSGTNVFAVVVDGQTTTTRLAGGGPPGPNGPGAKGSADPGRAAAFALLERLLDPAETWGAPGAPGTMYAPSGYRIFVAPGAPATDPATTRPPVAWPLATSLDAFGTATVPDRGVTGLRQGVALGADAAVLKPILEAATIATGFTSGGKTYTLFVRPLLPDELGA